MADPITAMMVASAALSAAGSIQQGNAQYASYMSQANANEYNATVDKLNAQVASDEANAKEEQQRRKFGQVQGAAYAGAAQSGTGFEGSNADLLKQNAVLNELDALTIRYEGQNKSRALEDSSKLNTYYAGVNKQNASSARTAGFVNAGAQLLSAGSTYSYYSKTGTLPKVS